MNTAVLEHGQSFWHALQYAENQDILSASRGLLMTLCVDSSLMQLKTIASLHAPFHKIVWPDQSDQKRRYTIILRCIFAVLESSTKHRPCQQEHIQHAARHDRHRPLSATAEVQAHILLQLSPAEQPRTAGQNHGYRSILYNARQWRWCTAAFRYDIQTA